MPGTLRFAAKAGTNNMNTSNQDPTDGVLGSLLRESRPAPGLPPRFQENVWQRIEHKGQPAPASNWLEAFAALVLKPRFALAAVCALVLVGVTLGSLDGRSHARHDAQERYLAAVVAPVH